MNQKRAHQYCTASGNGTDNAWPLSPSCNFLRRKTTGLVRAGNHPQRTIAFVTIIQVQPDGYHPSHD